VTLAVSGGVTFTDLPKAKNGYSTQSSIAPKT